MLGKKVKVSLLCFGFLLLSCSSKHDECATILPPPADVNIIIVNSEGVSLLGEDNIFKPSEILLQRDGQNTGALYFTEDELNSNVVMVIHYGILQSGVNYNLILNSEETDLLNFSIQRINGPCYDVFELESFKLNGSEVPFDEDLFYYIIEK